MVRGNTAIQLKPASFFLLLFALSLVGCHGLIRDGQENSTSFIILNAKHPAGQTFVAGNDGLYAIQLFLKPETQGQGEIQLRLSSAPDSGKDLAVSRLDLASINHPGYYTFSFSPQSGSRRLYYYASWKIRGTGAIQIGMAPGNSYLNGSAYAGSFPLDAQLAFRLVYHPGLALLGFSLELLKWLGFLTAGCLVFLLPGWALLRLLLPGWSGLSWMEKIACAGGASLAIYPLFFMWTDSAGVHLGALNVWLPLALGAGVLLFSLLNNRPRIVFHRSAFDLSLLAVLALLVFTRYWSIRSLEGPMWGDSYQHTVMAQLILDHGGLFQSWLPYTPYRSLTNQFGFSTYVAIYSWLTGINSVRSTIVVGQMVNLLAVICLYPLAVRLAKGNSWAGLGAILAAGLLTPMPAYYVNWGRYAQLAGQAILPIAIWMAWEVTDRGREISDAVARQFIYHTWWSAARRILIAAIILGGMVLAYYRTPFYYATFLLAWLFGWGIPSWQLDGKKWAFNLALLFLIGAVGVLCILPWVPRVSGGTLANSIEAGVSVGAPLDWVRADYQVWRELLFYVPWLPLLLALAGLIVSLIRRQWVVASLAFWAVLLSSLVAGSLFHLPGANMMQSFAVLIALYIPVGLIAGWLIGEVAGWSSTWFRLQPGLLPGLALVTIALWGAWNQRTIAQPATFALITRPDLRAMAWIRKQTPENALFLVEGFRIYNGTSAAGADAGWWIPILAGRANTIPPQYAINNEEPWQPGYSRQVVNLVASLERTTLDSPEGIQLLCEWNITHLYIGQGQGLVSYGNTQLFSPDELRASNSMRLVYHQDRVYIFAMDPGACSSALARDKYAIHQ